MQLLLGILLVALSAADEPVQRTPEDFQKALDVHKKHIDKIFDPAYWKKIDIKNKTTDIEMKFTELDKMEQLTFVLMFSQQLLEQTQKLQKEWDSKSYPEIPQKELAKYRQELLEHRKRLTEGYAKHIDTMIEELKDEISEAEKKTLLRKVKKVRELLPKD